MRRLTDNISDVDSSLKIRIRHRVHLMQRHIDSTRASMAVCTQLDMTALVTSV